MSFKYEKVRKMSDCPKCGNAINEVTECDNDCGTFQCPDCETEWHLDVTDNATLLGHHPDCGIKSEEGIIGDDY